MFAFDCNWQATVCCEINIQSTKSWLALVKRHDAIYCISIHPMTVCVAVCKYCEWKTTKRAPYLDFIGRQGCRLHEIIHTHVTHTHSHTLGLEHIWINDYKFARFNKQHESQTSKHHLNSRVQHLVRCYCDCLCRGRWWDGFPRWSMYSRSCAENPRFHF